MVPSNFEGSKVFVLRGLVTYGGTQNIRAQSPEAHLELEAVGDGARCAVAGPAPPRRENSEESSASSLMIVRKKYAPGTYSLL